MILPHRWLHRPRITLGQILASVAVSTVPIALIMRAVSRTESIGDIILASCFCLVLTFLFEVFFWGFLVPLIAPLNRTLGRPSWFTWELIIDSDGIRWVDPERRDEPPAPPSDGGDAGIRFMD